MLAWFTFAATFLFRKKPKATPDKKRDPSSMVGVLIQAGSYSVVWGVRRHPFSFIVSANRPVEILLAAITVVVAFGSVATVMAAVRTLGKEWSITARVVEGHKLAISGPYRFVRHPIYTGMLGMLVATGLAFSHWIALLAAVVVFFIGTIIRVRKEERLLRETFGAEFDAYSQHVSAIVPFLY